MTQFRFLFSIFGAWLVLLLALPGTASSVEVKGTLIGEECAKKVEVVDCSLKDSWPLAIFTDDGTYYVVEPDGVDRAELDKIFGLEVLAKGQVEGNVLKVAEIQSLVPVGSKEFTKG